MHVWCETCDCHADSMKYLITIELGGCQDLSSPVHTKLAIISPSSTQQAWGHAPHLAPMRADQPPSLPQRQACTCAPCLAHPAAAAAQLVAAAPHHPHQIPLASCGAPIMHAQHTPAAHTRAPRLGHHAVIAGVHVAATAIRQGVGIHTLRPVAGRGGLVAAVQQGAAVGVARRAAGAQRRGGQLANPGLVGQELAGWAGLGVGAPGRAAADAGAEAEAAVGAGRLGAAGGGTGCAQGLGGGACQSGVAAIGAVYAPESAAASLCVSIRVEPSAYMRRVPQQGARWHRHDHLLAAVYVQGGPVPSVPPAERLCRNIYRENIDISLPRRQARRPTKRNHAQQAKPSSEDTAVPHQSACIALLVYSAHSCTSRGRF